MRNTNVFILCGGEGKRLRPKFTLVPKVLVPVRNEPMLSHIIKNLENQGFKDYVLGTGYLSEQIESFVQSQYPDLKTVISNSGVQAGMLQRIYLAQPHFKQTVVVVYGDTLVNLNYADLLKKHKESQAPVTAVVGKIRNPFGVVTLDDAQSKIVSFVEKPIYNYYIGCLVVQKEALDRINKSSLALPDGQGLIAYFQQLIKKGELHAYQHEGLQITFNTVSELEDAETQLNEYYTLKES